MKTIKHKNVSDADQRGLKTGRGVSAALAADADSRLVQLTQAQSVSIVKDVVDLAVDFWPEGETADDVNGYIYRQRYDDRM